MVCRKKEVQNIDNKLTPPPQTLQRIRTSQHPRDASWCIDWIDTQEDPIEARYELMELVCQDPKKLTN